METEIDNELVAKICKDEAPFDKEVLKRNLQTAGKISTLYIYPVKSCRGIEVESAECTALGLKCGILRDRSFTLIDSKGVNIDCLREPTLLRVTPTLQNFNELCLDAPGKNTLKIYFDELHNSKNKPTQHYRVSEQDAYGIDCGEWTSRWFSSYLNRENVRLLYYMDNLPPKYLMKYERFQSLPGQKETDITAYANYTPYMIASQSSLDDIQRRFNKWLGMRRFRPNIVVDGAPAYAEESWKYICINDVWLKNILPCARCYIPTVDPETGKRNKKGEPFKFMKSFRQAIDPEVRKFTGDGPLMGIKLTIENTGRISVGDPAYAIHKKIRKRSF